MYPATDLEWELTLRVQVSTVTAANVFRSLGVDNSWNEEKWKRDFKVATKNRVLTFYSAKKHYC